MDEQTQRKRDAQQPSKPRRVIRSTIRGTPPPPVRSGKKVQPKVKQQPAKEKAKAQRPTGQQVTRRSDLGPGSVKARLQRTERGLILCHSRGEDLLVFNVHPAVTRLLAGKSLSWIVHERLPNGALRASPVLTGELESEVRKVLESLAAQARSRAERRIFELVFGHGRKRKKGSAQGATAAEELERSWAAYRNAMTDSDPDSLPDKILFVLVTTSKHTRLQPLMFRAFRRFGIERLVRFIEENRNRLPATLPPALASRLSPPLPKRTAVRKKYPRIDTEADRREHLLELQRHRAEAPRDPMAEARRRIGPVQNYGDDT